jgi:hypothetical protein
VAINQSIPLISLPGLVPRHQPQPAAVGHVAFPPETAAPDRQSGRLYPWAVLLPPVPQLTEPAFAYRMHLAFTFADLASVIGPRL